MCLIAVTYVVEYFQEFWKKEKFKKWFITITCKFEKEEIGFKKYFIQNKLEKSCLVNKVSGDLGLLHQEKYLKIIL
jgi:hypothetical protein